MRKSASVGQGETSSPSQTDNRAVPVITVSYVALSGRPPQHSQVKRHFSVPNYNQSRSSRSLLGPHRLEIIELSRMHQQYEIIATHVDGDHVDQTSMLQTVLTGGTTGTLCNPELHA